MLRYNIENLSQDHLATIIGVLDRDADGQQIAAAWIAKEHLRDLLALRATRTHVTPAPSAVRDKLASFCLWCGVCQVNGVTSFSVVTCVPRSGGRRR